MTVSADRSDEDWRPETEAERARRLAATWTLADKLAWLEEITLLAAHLHDQRRKAGLPCVERPPLDW